MDFSRCNPLVLHVLPRTGNRTSRISKPVVRARSFVHPQNLGNLWPATAMLVVSVEPRSIPPGNRRCWISSMACQNGRIRQTRLVWLIMVVMNRRAFTVVLTPCNGASSAAAAEKPHFRRRCLGQGGYRLWLGWWKCRIVGSVNSS
jgi:hypothetical protein